MSEAPQLEPMADVVFVVCELQKLVRRLDPCFDVFERLQKLHAENKALKAEIAQLKSQHGVV